MSVRCFACSNLGIKRIDAAGLNPDQHVIRFELRAGKICFPYPRAGSRLCRLAYRIPLKSGGAAISMAQYVFFALPRRMFTPTIGP